MVTPILLRVVSLWSRKKISKNLWPGFWQFHKLVRREPLRVKQHTLKLNLLWISTPKTIQIQWINHSHSNTSELTIEWHQALCCRISWIAFYKIELNALQLSMWLKLAVFVSVVPWKRTLCFISFLSSWHDTTVCKVSSEIYNKFYFYTVGNHLKIQTMLQ